MHSSDLFLSFDREAREYLARELYKREDDDIEFIFNSVAVIPTRPIKNYILIPFFYSENFSEAYLGFLKNSCQTADIQVIIFFNASQADTGAKVFDDAKEALLSIVEALGVGDRITVISRFFTTPASIGRIRGLVADIALLSALGSYQNCPWLIFHDADTVDVCIEYLDSINTYNPASVTFISGPVYFGYSGLTSIGLGEHQLPELYIFNKINDAINFLARTGQVNFEKRIWPSGANIAISAAAYCAVGGFDFSRQSGEDDAIGRSLHRYNPNAITEGLASSDLIFVPDPQLHSVFEENAWTATDPRRTVKTIIYGADATETWTAQPFVSIRGADLKTSGLIDEYMSSHYALRHSDICRSLEAPGSIESRALMSRILGILERAGEADFRIRNDEQYRLFLRQCGVNPTNARLGTALTVPQDHSWASWKLMRELRDLKNVAPYRP
ncbi:hypothetical protein [Rhizobium leguminosarum]|uniref:hypothetical protein n=1 Tax=Rhizobium leguminosarum TaxID=384 RepID=UPI0013DAB010|nr:hypothetical protein [Rhizobium leguminosarum]NEI02408.1 hypothetical protein [Rhizobium leguminosarum]